MNVSVKKSFLRITASLLAILLLWLDITWADPTISLTPRSDTLAVPSIFINNLSLSPDFTTELSFQERAELFFFLNYIQDYFFSVPESVAKEREKYIAQIIRKELGRGTFQVLEGIDIDGIRFDKGEAYVPYVGADGDKTFKVGRNVLGYEDVTQKELETTPKREKIEIDTPAIEDQDSHEKDGTDETVESLLNIATDPKLKGKERDAAVYELILRYQELGTEEEKASFLLKITDRNISTRILNNVLGQIQNFRQAVDNVLLRASEKAQEWALRAAQTPIPRVLMMIAGPTMNCGSGVVVESLALEHQRRGGSLALSLAYRKPLLPKDLKLEETALVDTIIFSESDTADTKLTIPVFSSGMPFNPIRYKDMSKRDLVEFLEIYYHRLKIFIEEYQPDVIHTNHLFLLNPLVQLIAPWIPIVSTTHGTEQKMLQEAPEMLSLVRPAIKRLDRVLSISDDISEETQKMYGLKDEQIEMIGNGLDARIFHPRNVDRKQLLDRYGIDGDYDKVVLYVGRYVRWKKLDYLLEAAADYSNEIPGKVLTLFVGTGADEIVAEYRDFIASKGMEENIKILNKWVSMEEVGELLNIADVFALPSDNEPFSLGLLQALACGRRVIASDRGGPQMLVRPGLIADGHAVLVAPIPQGKPEKGVSEQQAKRYVEDFKNGIKALLSEEVSDKERKRISETVQEYSWTSVYGKVDDVYREVIKKRIEGYGPKPHSGDLTGFSRQVKVVEVHPTNQCNLSCYKCPYGALHEGGATLLFENIDKIAEMQPESIFVLGGGEPSMYSWEGYDIYDFMRKLRTQNPLAKISLCTNGIIYLEQDLQDNIDILRVSTHGLKGEHFQHHGEDMPEFVKQIWTNIWRYFKEGTVQEQWTTFLFHKSNVMDALVIAEELWKNWDRMCREDPALRKKKFGFKLLYIADDAVPEDPFHLSNPDEEIERHWHEGINAIKQSGRPFGEFLGNYREETTGFILPKEIYEAKLPLREVSKVDSCPLAKGHALIGADGNIYPCRIQAAASEHSYGRIEETSLQELLSERVNFFSDPLPECAHGCRLTQTLIGQTIGQNDPEDNRRPPREDETRVRGQETRDLQTEQKPEENPLEQVRGLLHNASTYGNMSTGKWLAFPDRAELVAQGRFDDIMPVNAQFVPSERCPSNCLTCTYGRSKDEISRCKDKSRYVMAFDDMKLYIDRLADAGVQSITFTGGGDPLFNKNLFEGIEYASRGRGLATGLFTEAHLVTDQIAERMVNVGLKFIRISFNAGRPITYKHFFGVPETMFYRALENVEKIAAAKEKFGKKLGLGVGVIITPLNFRELMEIARLIQAIADRHPGALQHIWYRPAVRYLRGVQLENTKTADCLEYIRTHPDLNRYYDDYYRFTYDAEQFPAYIFQAAMDDLEFRIRPYIEDRINGLSIFYPKTRIEAMDEIKKGFNQCRACPWLTFIGSDGNVYHCVEHGLDPAAVYGNLKSQTLDEIWQSQRRRDVIDFMKQEGLEKRCPPMCMLTEQNRAFETIAEALQTDEDREAVKKAIKIESRRFMDNIGRKIGDGIKFMQVGVLFALGILLVEMGFPLLIGRLLMAADLALILGLSISRMSSLQGKSTMAQKPRSHIEIPDSVHDVREQPQVSKSQAIRFTIISLFHDRYIFYAESLGPSVIKTYLKEQFQDKVEVDLVDLQFERNVDEVLQRLSVDPPEIIGLSAKVLTYAQMMEILEKRNKYKSFKEEGTLFVVGNVTGATAYEEIVRKHEDVMVVVGEGEEASRDLVSFVRGDKEIGEISNTAYWDKDRGQVVLNPVSDTLDFARLPLPDRQSATETLKRKGVVYAEFSRGCSWGKCTFCSMWTCQKREWRHKSLDDLLVELDALQEMGATHFEFTDSDFMGPNAKKASDLDIYKEFARRKIEAKNNLTFFAYLRVHSVYRQGDTEEVRQAKIETLKLLKEAGLKVVNIGGDFGSDKQSARFRKGTTKEEVKGAIRVLEEVGIENIKLGMVLFDPFMSFDELEEGIKFIETARLSEYIRFPFARVTFYETSPLTSLAKEEGILGEERTEALAFRATDFIDQRVGRLSRIFDAWHSGNKPIIFGIQEIRREGEVSCEIQSKAHYVLGNLRGQYYHLLGDMVSAYSGKDNHKLEAALFKHLTIRAGYLKELFELLKYSRGDGKASNNVYREAMALYYSDLLVIKVLMDSAKGLYLDWDQYRDWLDLEPDLSGEDRKDILNRTFMRVQEQIKFRNPKLRIPKPKIEEYWKSKGNELIKWRAVEPSHSECRHITSAQKVSKTYPDPQNAMYKQREKVFDQVVLKIASFTGASYEAVNQEIDLLRTSEKGAKMLWALSRRLEQISDPEHNELMSKMDLDAAIKYLLMLSWDIESGNDDLVFIDQYPSHNNANIDDLQKATKFCFNEIDVNKKSSITVKKVLLSVQTNSFSLSEIPRILEDEKNEPFEAIFDRRGQLTSRNIGIPEIDGLMLDNRVFNPVIHYQMTGLLASIIPSMKGEKFLDIGSGTGVLGIVAALRNADKVVGVDINKHACELSRINTRKYGVEDKVDIREVTDGMEGRFFEALDGSERFDTIIVNPPWGASTMSGELGKALSDPDQSFLRYFLQEAPHYLSSSGEIIIGYSSRNDYNEKNLIDVMESLRGVVDYDWEIIGSLEFTRPLYSEMFYAVRLTPVGVDRSYESYLNNRQAQVIRAYNEVSTSGYIRAEDGVEKIVLAVMGLIEERGEEKDIKRQIDIMKANVGRLYIDSIVASAIVKARSAKRMDQRIVIGLDTSWIPGMGKGDLQHNLMAPFLRELAGLENILRKLGFKNVKVVLSEGDSLAGEVLDAMKSEQGSGMKDTTFGNVIILADKSVVEAESFAVIRDGKGYERPFIAGIDATQLRAQYKECMNEQLYISIIEMITLTLEASVGVDISGSSLVDTIDIENNMIVFMPVVEVILYEMLRERYLGYIRLLQAA